MLDMITDFWKPTNKKPQLQENIRPEDVRVGSTLVFGFVPQASLSGQRLEVSAINTYQFGEEKLTSFTLSQDNATSVTNVASMIFAESDGEYYLAISRRILAEERDKLFDKSHLQSVMEDKEVSRLPLREIMSEFKGWTVASYKREIQGMKGRFYRGDFRRAALPAASEGQQFDYMLLVSDSNEHAIEIEKYEDGRVEIYTTVYRRMSDIGEVSYSPVMRSASEVPESSNQNTPVVEDKVEVKAEAKHEPLKTVFAPLNPAPATVTVSAPVITMPEPVAEPVVALEAAAEEEAPKPTRMKWPELSASAVVAPEAEAPAEVKAGPVIAAPVLEKAAEPLVETVPVKAEQTAEVKPAPEEEKIMPAIETTHNGVKADMNTATTDLKPNNVISHPAAPEAAVRAVAKQSIEASDSIECDLRVANKIIDEAIRNEMRLGDVVRRIVELPVANPESVHIPMTLTDEDYSLLAIRYGLPASDKNAIKKRIIEDLNDFSGANKKAA